MSAWTPRGGQVVVLTDAVGRGGKRYMLEGRDIFALRDEAGSCKTKRYTTAELVALHEAGKLRAE